MDAEPNNNIPLTAPKDNRYQVVMVGACRADRAGQLYVMVENAKVHESIAYTAGTSVYSSLTARKFRIGTVPPLSTLASAQPPTTPCGGCNFALLCLLSPELIDGIGNRARHNRPPICCGALGRGRSRPSMPSLPGDLQPSFASAFPGHYNARTNGIGARNATGPL